MKKKVLIIQANYYKDISTALLKSATNELKNFAKINIISVPGVFEIPVVISKNLKKYDGFVALGCVIKGQTPHFDFISKSTTDAIMNISVESKKPVGNGIITCLNKNQAIARGKKGREAANAVKIILSL
ncbi:6,7-dimethyl-8-ribityllumazine synthase [Candidatus Pelagibacter sp.]|nr:6,7-dimethyl-8-ribityllumazine synthase [Candidatus Pelagibacter sp.]